MKLISCANSGDLTGTTHGLNATSPQMVHSKSSSWGMMGRRVVVKVVRSMCGRLGKPGRMRTRVEVDWVPSGIMPAREESVEAAAMNCGNPSDAVSAVRLSCFLSYSRKEIGRAHV